MNTKNKELLLRDLGLRLQYGVKVACGVETRPYTLMGINPNACGASEIQVTSENGITCDCHIDCVKPYLRSFSTMTKEEENELWDMNIFDEEMDFYPCDISAIFEGETCMCWDEINRLIIWSCTHHFDFNWLIEKGIALEAPKEMYLI